MNFDERRRPSFAAAGTKQIRLTQNLERKCREVNQLGRFESLSQCIACDHNTLAKYNLAPKDIFVNHFNMYTLFSFANDCGSSREDFLEMKLAASSRDSNWPPLDKISMGPPITKEIRMNGYDFRVTCVLWLDHMKCPTQQQGDQNFYGDRDWYIRNLSTKRSLFIADLVPAQVGTFGFFHGATSLYRLNPETYIRLFRLEKNCRIPGRLPQVLLTHRKMWKPFGGAISLEEFEKNVRPLLGDDNKLRMKGIWCAKFSIGFVAYFISNNAIFEFLYFRMVQGKFDDYLRMLRSQDDEYIIDDVYGSSLKIQEPIDYGGHDPMSVYMIYRKGEQWMLSNLKGHPNKNK